ncbi:MAG: hypothetical protein AB1689_28195 [Thermodesulfobacteriota bacterium]
MDAVVAGAALLLVAGGLAHACVTHRAFVAQHPQNLAWIALSLLAGFLTFLANGVVGPRGRVLLWAGYGTFAMLAGFNVQGLVNGSIARLVPPPERGALTFLALGVGAGACQTLGKWLMVAILSRVHQPGRRADLLAMGLAVGLGFGLSEVVFIGTRVIEAQTPITGLGVIGIWERAAAVGFHVYSAGLVAAALALRRAWPIALVVVVHGLEDWLAGAVGAGVLAIPIVVLEGIYTVATVGVWLAFRRAARGVARGASSHGTPQ